MTLATQTRVPFALSDRSVEGMGIEEALDHSYLSGWNVRTTPFQAIAEGTILDAPRHRMIVRDNPATGVVETVAPTGLTYTTVQNEELGAFAAALLDDSDLVVDSVGAVKDGRRVFITLRSPESITYGPNEEIRPYLLLGTGHDGGMSTIVKAMNVRLVCTNQLSGVLRGGQSIYRVRHTGQSIDRKIVQARNVLGIQHRAQDELDAEIRRLLGTPFVARQFDEVVDFIAPNDDSLSPAGQTRREKVRDDLWATWSADTNATAGNTAWRAVQTVGEYFDWIGGSDKTRAQRNVLGQQERGKAKATAKILSLV